jgi:hypothetical protein
MRTLVALVALVVLVTGCGRTDIEDAQRAWLEDQHRLDKRLLEVRGEHDDLMRVRAVIAAPTDTAVADSLVRADSILNAHAGRLRDIDTLVDRHSLARDNAIRADDAEAVDSTWKRAKGDYDRVMSVLDAIDRENESVRTMLGRISTSTTSNAASVDTGATPRLRDTATAPSTPATPAVKPDAEELDNNLGRDEPLEPE